MPPSASFVYFMKVIQVRLDCTDQKDSTYKYKYNRAIKIKSVKNFGPLFENENQYQESCFCCPISPDEISPFLDFLGEKKPTNFNNRDY